MFTIRVYGAGSYVQTNIWQSGAAAWKAYAAPRPGGGNWSRAEVVASYTKYYYQGHGNGNPGKFDYCMVRIVWAYFVQNGHDVTSFTNIDSEGAQANCHFHANGDGDCEYYLEWGNAPGTYQHNFGWSNTGLSGTGDQNFNYHITGEGAGAMVYFRFRTRNTGNTGVVYCPEHSFRTLGGGSTSASMVQ
jgi:hypothetical protein